MSSSLSYCISYTPPYAVAIYINNNIIMYAWYILRIMPRNSRANPLCYRFLIVLVVNENNIYYIAFPVYEPAR